MRRTRQRRYCCQVSTAIITLIGKPGCHLCDAARETITAVVQQLDSEASAPTVTVEELSILEDAALLDRYADEIPVVLINGRVHNIWRVDPARLRAALMEV
nr:glutaredoxin family protein [Frigoribacterium sp. CG_9.8]